MICDWDQRHVYMHGCMQIYVMKHKHLHRCEY